MLCRPRIFYAGGDAAEKDIPNNGSGTCAVPLYPCDMGGAADRPVPWRRSAGAAIKLNCRAGTALPDPMDRQESVVHSRLHRRVSHGAVSLCFRTGQNTGRRGTRLRRMGLSPAAQRAVPSKGEQDPHPPCATGAGYPQAPALTECAGHWRQRRRQNPRLCQAQHSGSKQQLCDHGPEDGGADRHRRVSETAGIRHPSAESGRSVAVGRL